MIRGGNHIYLAEIKQKLQQNEKISLTIKLKT